MVLAGVFLGIYLLFESWGSNPKGVNWNNNKAGSIRSSKVLILGMHTIQAFPFCYRLSLSSAYRLGSLSPRPCRGVI